MQAGLLDVLQGAVPGGPRITRQGDGARPGLRRSSVEAHIRRLLSARRGQPAHLAGYGLPQLPERYQDLDYVATRIARDAEALLERYEPRLRTVRVRARPAPPREGLVLELQVRGEVADSGTLSLDLGIAGSGALRPLEGER